MKDISSQLIFRAKQIKTMFACQIIIFSQDKSNCSSS